jgi:hypothetical protein
LGAKENLRVATDSAESGRYKDAYLSYIDCIEIPWLYKHGEPVKALEKLRGQLSDSEKEEADARMKQRLEELFKSDWKRNEIESGLKKQRHSHEKSAYLFILKEAKRLNVL